MINRFAWLAIEVADLQRADKLYRETLGLRMIGERPHERRYAVGESQLRLRTPNAQPNGGIHVHFAFGTAEESYDEWWDRLSERFDLEEHSFGMYRSLYFEDSDGHCVEIGQQPVQGDGLETIFEVVLEVADLERALSFYQLAGFDLVDLGEERPRARLRSNAVALELWEPHRGLAGARGGEHVDLGIGVESVSEVRTKLEEVALAENESSDAVTLRDPDGHRITWIES